MLKILIFVEKFSFSIHKLRKVYHGKEDVVAVNGKKKIN